MARELHIQTFEWRGQIRYRCPEPGCQFDSYTLNGREGMLYHVAKTHSAPTKTPPTTPAPKLFDGAGKEIQPEKEIVGGDDVLRVLKKHGFDGAHIHVHPSSSEEGTEQPTPPVDPTPEKKSLHKKKK